MFWGFLVGRSVALGGKGRFGTKQATRMSWEVLSMPKIQLICLIYWLLASGKRINLGVFFNTNNQLICLIASLLAGGKRY